MAKIVVLAARLAPRRPGHDDVERLQNLHVILQVQRLQCFPNVLEGGAETRQGKAKQSKARQGRARQGKARKSKAKQSKARQGKARQDKARPSKVMTR